MDIRRDDTVIVLSGRDKGVKGKILSVDAKKGKIIVEGVSVGKRHQRPRKQGEEGGIVDKATPIYACKVMRVCPKCGKPTRASYRIHEDGSKVRVCKKCGAEI